MKKKIIPFIIGALMLTGCDDLFSPAIENFQGVENMYNDAEYARGILHNVYPGQCRVNLCLHFRRPCQ